MKTLRGVDPVMDDLPEWAIPAVAGFGACLVIVLFILAFQARPKTSKKRAVRGSFQLTCNVCQRELVIAMQDLRLLVGTEIGLAVRAIPAIVGRKLADYVCPYCEADHCFAVESGRPEWVGVNLYSPQTGGSQCMDCRKQLQRPPWPQGEYQGRPLEAPNPSPDYGLVCSRCDAVCCVACVKSATRNRTSDGSLLCPRCKRSPVDTYFYP